VAESPSNTRAKSLSTKLQELQASLENEKLDRQATIDAKFRYLEEKLNSQQTSQEAHYKTIKDELVTLENRLEAARLDRDQLDEQTTKAIKDIESAARKNISADQHSYKESESQLLKTIDERFYHLALELAETRRRREEGENRLSGELSEQLGLLVSSVDREQAVMYGVFMQSEC